MSQVHGPVSEEDSKGLHWVIGSPITPESFVPGSPRSGAESPSRRRDLTNGVPPVTAGDKYSVKLRIAGRFRTVEWETVKLRAINWNDKEAVKTSNDISDDGRYFIAASWNCWACTQELVKVGLGKYQAEVTLASSRGSFQVVRNKDWSQTLYPCGDVVVGPGSAPYDHSWEVEGTSGDVIKVTLQRTWKAANWTQTLHWEKVGSRPLSELAPAESNWPRFFLAGAGSAVKFELEPVGHLRYGITLLLTDGHVPFTIICNGDFRRVFYPSVKSATPTTRHTILGPHASPPSTSSWLIQRDLDDIAAEGGWYTVELTVRASDHIPSAVRWRRTA